MNMNEWTPSMRQQRIADLRKAYINTKNSKHLTAQQKAEKLASIARKGKAHAARLHVTVKQVPNAAIVDTNVQAAYDRYVYSMVMEYPVAV